ncbi:hypothetical protein ExPUPEC61_03723 [Escherichia coli]|nr:hypothetical protein ExPUPEC61_03723 [Escherichia coli]
MPLVILLNVAVAGIHFVAVFILHRNVTRALNRHVQWAFGFLRNTSTVVHAADPFLRHIARVEAAAFHLVIGRHCHIGAKTVGVDVCQVVGADLLLVQGLRSPAQGGINQAVHYIAWNSASSSCVLVAITLVLA